MNLKLVVKKNKATCPHCHTDLDVISHVKGYGTRPQGDKKIRKITQGYKMEIIKAYLREPEKTYTVKDIMLRINYTRFSNGIKKMAEQCNLTRPHGELMDAGIIITVDTSKQPFRHMIDAAKARELLR